VQKDNQVTGVFLCFWELSAKKSMRKMLVKLTPGVNFTNPLKQSTNAQVDGVDAILLH